MTQEEYLKDISEKIVEIFGLNFTSSQYIDLERRLIAASKELRIDPNIQAIHDFLLQNVLSNAEIKTLSAHLTIGETYFFREKTALDLFVHKIIPDLIHQRQYNSKKIRIWSAGCSSGEEAYTIAILIKEHFPQLIDWDISILATDISPIAIQKALHGEYTEWSFRDTANEIKNKYFTASGKSWKIIPEVQKMLSFAYLNLSKESYPSSITNTDAMDVIFCRNVMMYLSPPVIHAVSNRFYNSLATNAWLITSQVELNDEYFSNFERIHYRKGIFYQKTNRPNKVIQIQTETITDTIAEKPIKKPAQKAGIEKKVFPLKVVEKEKTDESRDAAEYFQKGQYQQCINSCLQLIEKEGIDKNLFILLVKSYSNSGNPLGGSEMIKKIITTKAVTSEMYYLYASFLNEQNAKTESEAILKKAIYLNHEHILSHLMLADLFVKKDNKTLALKHYQKVAGLLEAYPDDSIVPESDGMTAGRIKELAVSMIKNL